MKSSLRFAPFAAAVALLLVAAQPTLAWHGHCGYGHGFGHYSFGFGAYYGAAPVYVAPAPVFFAPPPVVYYAPAVVAAPPVVVQQPVAVQQPPVVEQQEVAEQQTASPPACGKPAPAPQRSSFVEIARRYHLRGDNAGRLDWVEGLLDGRPIRVYYDDFGRIEKQKWVD